MNPRYYINIIYNKIFDLQNKLILLSRNRPQEWILKFSFFSINIASKHKTSDFTLVWITINLTLHIMTPRGYELNYTLTGYSIIKYVSIII